MLRDKHNDLLHLLTLLESLEKILAFSREADNAESFFRLNDQLNFNAVLNPDYAIGIVNGRSSPPGSPDSIRVAANPYFAQPPSETQSSPSSASKTPSHPKAGPPKTSFWGAKG